MQILSHHSPSLNDHIKFIIIAQPRTGSTLLSSLLNSHPDVRVLIEPINPIGHDHCMKPCGEGRVVPQARIDQNLTQVLDILFRKARMPEKWFKIKKTARRAAGFKIMIHQINALRNKEAFWDYIKSKNVKIICNYRRNILFQYVSELITLETRQSACWDGNVMNAKVMVPVESLVDKLSSIIKQREDINSKLDEEKLYYETIFYEEFKDNIKSVNRIMKYVIGEEYPMKTRLMKQNPDSLEQRVKNYKELVNRLSELGIAHFNEF